VITGPDGRAPAQVITSSPPTQTEDICKLIVVAQSDDADRPLSAVDTPSSRHPHPFLSTSSAFRKRWIRVVEKTTVYRSSAVSSAQALPTHAASARRKRPAGPCSNTPGNHLGGTKSGPSPAGGPTLHHRPLPRLVSFSDPWPVPTLRAASELYSCAIQQRRRPTPVHNVLWVPNSSSTAVTCGIARRWLSGMIVGRGGATALSHLPAARGMAGTAGP
jgi:hypothetical protein